MKVFITLFISLFTLSAVLAQPCTVVSKPAGHKVFVMPAGAGETDYIKGRVILKVIPECASCCGENAIGIESLNNAFSEL